MFTAQVIGCVSAEGIKRHMNGPGWTHDWCVVYVIGNRDFAAQKRPVTSRLIERCVRALGGAEPRASKSQRGEDFLFDKVFPSLSGTCSAIAPAIVKPTFE